MYMSEIRARIRGLEQNEHNLIHKGLLEISEKNQLIGYNQCLNDVLAILNEAVIEVKKPTEKGFYWIFEELYRSCVYVSEISALDKRLFCFYQGKPTLIDDVSGRWFKAILPEPKG